MSYIIFALLCVSSFLLIGLTPQVITDDILILLKPKDSLYEMKKAIQGNKKTHKIYRKIIEIKNALESTGRRNTFNIVIYLSFILCIIGVLISVLANNIFMIIPLTVFLMIIPFLYVNNTLEHYKKQMNEELETALSIISSSYIRSLDIVDSVRENMKYIRPPLKKHFEQFLFDTSYVSSNIKSALYKLRDSIDNVVFNEWCDALILCQDDRNMSDTLIPIVSKLNQIRLVNNDMNTVVIGARREYYVMAALLVANIPLIYVLNKDWFDILINSTTGKLVLGICACVLMVTFLLMRKFTRPIEYRKGEKK